MSGHFFMVELGSVLLALETLGASPSVSDGISESSQIHDKDVSDGERTIANHYAFGGTFPTLV